MHATDPRHPYETLTPDVVQDALGHIGLWGDGRLAALNSFENRVYQIHLESPFEGHGQVVAKFYRPGRWSDAQIAEEHAFAAELVAAEIPAVPPLAVNGQTLHHFGGFAFAVSPRRGGRRPELDDFEVLEWIGRFLARLHTVGAARPFAHRPALDSASFAREPRDWLLEHEMIAPEVRREWCAALDEALTLIEAHPVLRAGGDSDPQGIARLRLHGDCHPGNILWRDDQAHFVDLDDCLSGPAVQDLWMLAGRREDMARPLRWLLEGYEQFRRFDRRELHLVETLRTLRLLHHNAWIARRWHDPAFPAAFPWFEAPRHWESVITQMQEQLAALQEPPPDPD